MNVLSSYSAINTAKLGTRVRDRDGHTARRIRGGWVYEGSPAAGKLATWQLLEQVPLTVLEVVDVPVRLPPAPRVPTRIIGRFQWPNGGWSPWVSFATETEHQFWARDIRKALPGIKVERAFLDLVHTADTLLSSAQSHAVGNAQE